MGKAPCDEDVLKVLRSLGFGVQIEGDSFKAVPPYWRSDIKFDVDIAEEIARIIGYDKISMRMIAAPIPPYVEQPMLQLKRKGRRYDERPGLSGDNHLLVGWAKRRRYRASESNK